MINIMKPNISMEGVMSRSKTTQDAWDQIFDDLILESEPPIRYIKDAIIVTKNGSKFKVSPDDFAHIVARERMMDPDHSDIQSLSLSLDFAKIKRDVNRWTSRLISSIESSSVNATRSTDKKAPAARKSRTKKGP